MDKGIIGAILRDRIKEMGYTQEAFAEETGISLSALKKYMKGTNAYNYELMEIFSEKLDCSYDYLLGLSKSAKREFQNISNQLRLSDMTIEKLTKYATGYDVNFDCKRYIKTVDAMIRTDGLINVLSEYMIQSRHMGKLYQLLGDKLNTSLMQNEKFQQFMVADDYQINAETMLLIDVISKLKDAKNSIGSELVEELKALQPIDAFEQALDILPQFQAQGVIKRND